MFIASFFGWFLGEFFRSTLLLIGGAILALILVPLLFLFIAEFVHPLLPKNGSRDDGVIAQVEEEEGLEEEFDYLEDYIAWIDEEENEDEPVDYKFRLNEYEHILEEETCATSRSNLTDWIADRLRSKGMFRYFWSEKYWWLDPPVGPVPSQAWFGPPISLEIDQCIFYVVAINVVMASGAKEVIYKPGITSKGVVVGSGGRYAKNSKVERVVCERSGLTAMQAWTVEQKMLRIMHQCPWSDSFQLRLDWLNGCYEVDNPIVTAADVRRLGLSEWRQWTLGDQDLNDLVDIVISHSS